MLMISLVYIPGDLGPSWTEPAVYATKHLRPHCDACFEAGFAGCNAIAGSIDIYHKYQFFTLKRFTHAGIPCFLANVFPSCTGKSPDRIPGTHELGLIEMAVFEQKVKIGYLFADNTSRYKGANYEQTRYVLVQDKMRPN